MGVVLRQRDRPSAMRRFRRFIQGFASTRHRLLNRRGLGWLGHWLDQPACWAIQRRKVAQGVALGLFTGLLPGPPKRLLTLLLALLLRVNLPAALLVTLYSNPLTILPLYFLAYSYGQLLLGSLATGTIGQPPVWLEQSLWQWVVDAGAWSLQLGWPLAVGLLALGLTLALSGYMAVMLGWRCVVVRNWKNRKAACGSC